tara:strand:- start:10 stop:2022 length:2013 start_codon:yes stop_codon:yes gene_type:complete
MSWKDNNKKIEKDDNSIPTINYFPIDTPGGQTIEAQGKLELDPETAALYDTMQFDEGRSPVGQTIGSITAAIATAKKSASLVGDTLNIKGKTVKNIIPKPLRVPFAIGSQLASAWTGGASGDLLQSSAQGDLKKHTWNTAVNSAFDAGNEEALYELLGLTVVGGVVKAAQWAIGKPYMNIKWIKDQITKSNGNLTASQVVDGTILDTIEGLTEASWGGRHIRETRKLNDTAINDYIFEFQENFIENVAKPMSDFEVGRMYQNAVKVAQDQHKKIGGQMFDHLDEVVEANRKFELKPIENINNSTILDSSGTNIQTTTQGFKQVELKPVSMKVLKAFAKRELKIIEGVEDSIKSWRYNYYKNLLENTDDFVSFGAAQKLRTEWLEKGRIFENKTLPNYSEADFGATKKLTQQLDRSMGDAAAKMGDEFNSEYRTANKYWKSGSKRLKNGLVSQLMMSNPEKVGSKIFATGNVSEIIQARQSLKAAENFTKGSANPIVFRDTWEKMQQGYISNLINKSRQGTELTQGAAEKFGSDIAGGELNLPALKQLFTDPEKLKTFNSAFTKDQRTSLKKFMSVVEVAQKRPEGAGTFMVTVTQAGLVIGAVGGAGVDAGLSALAALTITPAMLSRALVSPKVTTALANGINMKPTNKEYLPTLLKIFNYFGIAPSLTD